MFEKCTKVSEKKLEPRWVRFPYPLAFQKCITSALTKTIERFYKSPSTIIFTGDVDGENLLLAEDEMTISKKKHHQNKIKTLTGENIITGNERYSLYET